MSSNLLDVPFVYTVILNFFYHNTFCIFCHFHKGTARSDQLSWCQDLFGSRLGKQRELIVLLDSVLLAFVSVVLVLVKIVASAVVLLVVAEESVLASSL